MRSLFIILVLALPISSYGAFGMLGNDQCAYSQASFPTTPADNTQVIQAQIQELENSRLQIDAQITLVSTDMGKLQGYMRKYFPQRDANSPPWVDTMQAHMDNGMDCCAPDQQANVQTTSQNQHYSSYKRLPAGNEVIEVTPEPDDSYRPQPEPPVDVQPAPGYNNPPANANSCNGYDSQYCSQDWARGNYKAPPAGAAPICLQTGFSATPAWYYGACKNGGEIDPQVCSDPRISAAPNDAPNCAVVLDSYRKAAAQKRQLSSGLAQINIQIQGLKYPNRPSTSEVTSNGDGSNMLGSILGSVAQMALPFLFNQVSSYHAEKDYRFRSGPSGATPLYRNNRSGPPAGATYYGPNYGYGFSNNGVYGGQPPALQTGGFGCSTGTLGGGMNLMSLLFGGGRTNFNASGGIGATFGANGGGLLAGIGNFLFGNQNSNIPSYRFGGFNAPYQQGGIYGVRGAPAGSVRSNVGSISNFFSGGQAYPSNSGYRVQPFVNGNGYGGRYGPPQSAMLYPQGSSSGYLGNNNYQTPYFGNMGNMLSGLFNFNPSLNVNASAHFSLGN